MAIIKENIMTEENKVIEGKLELNEVGELPKEPEQTPHTLAETDEVRRGKHHEWLFVGKDPKSGVPIWRYDWAMRELNQKYPSAKLRQLRQERGVGSSKKRLQLATANAYKETLLDNPT